jgi:hypothetical protein
VHEKGTSSAPAGAEKKWKENGSGAFSPLPSLKLRPENGMIQYQTINI